MKRNWNIAFLKFLIIIAILPTLVQFVWAYLQHVSVMTLLLLLGVGIFIIAVLQGQLWRLLKSLALILITPFLWLVGLLDRRGRFMPWWERVSFISPYHKGLTVDGRNRLTPEVSYMNLLAIGGVGSGKSTVLAIPQIMLQNDASMVITDLSGELHQLTRKNLMQRGFEVQTVDLMTFRYGVGINPLEGIKTYEEVNAAATVLIRSSGMDRGNDPFWSTAAHSVLAVIIKCLVNLKEPKYLNLANVKHLLSHFSMREAMNEFVVHATLDDVETYNDYLALMSTGSEKTLGSILATANAALSGLSPELGRMTAQHDIDFQQLRKTKTALFIQVRQQDINQYVFILNLILTRLCQNLLSDLQEAQSGLPVDLILDEFGQLTIPDWEVFASTSRKYRVSFAVLLQSRDQLILRYGREQAQVIQDSIQTAIHFPGMGVQEAALLSRQLGKRQNGKQSAKALMSEDEIIHMKDDEALLLHRNKAPIKLKMKPFYKQRALRKHVEKRPLIRTSRTFPAVSYVPLNIGSIRQQNQISNPTSNEVPMDDIKPNGSTPSETNGE